MQILLRNDKDKYYVWKEAKFQNNKYYVDGLWRSDVNILAVKDFEDADKVTCKCCGVLINDDPESIERHFVEEEAKRDCLKCDRVSTYNERYSYEQQITPNGDGTYKITNSCNARLRCRDSWIDINNENITTGCKHYAHRRMGVEKLGGIFTKYPDLFAKQITVEALKEKGYGYRRCYNGWYQYDMNLRNTLFAYVNECGIVDHFKCSYKYDTRTFYYSATQGKLFYENSGRYVEGKPYEFSEAKYNSMKKKIEALYKEGKKK